MEEDDRLESFRRSIVAAKPIKEGTIIEDSMIDFKRPGRGLAPEALNYIVGKVAKRDIEYDELINMEDF
jgi:sialic acid synthase SpsE